MAEHPPSTAPNDLPDGVPGPLLRRAMGHFATGVAIVGACDAEGARHGTTANSVTSVSLNPPLVLVCLRHQSATLRAIRTSGRFGLSILAAHQRPASDRFARASDDADWEAVGHRVSDGVPVLDDALAVLVCEVHAIPDGGDHAIVIGRVVSADHVDEPSPALLFHRGAYLDPVSGPPETPSAGNLVAVPSRHGDLGIKVLAPDDAGELTVVATRGDISGRDDVLLYVHRGCVLADALNATCSRRRLLDRALAEIDDDRPGIVVYRRRHLGLDRCCREGGGPARQLAADEVVAVRRAVRQLGVAAVRVLGDAGIARTLADAGVRVAAAIDA